MNRDEMDSNGKLEVLLDTLHRIAQEYDEGSSEYAAIETAAKAVHFAYQDSVVQRFRAFLDDSGNGLNSQQLKYLKSLGLDEIEE